MRLARRKREIGRWQGEVKVRTARARRMRLWVNTGKSSNDGIKLWGTCGSAALAQPHVGICGATRFINIMSASMPVAPTRRTL